MNVSAEMTRILAIPPTAYADSWPAWPALRPFQARALHAWAEALAGETDFGPSGLAILAGCGAGKTLLSLLLPAVEAGAVHGAWTKADGSPAAELDRPYLYLTPSSAAAQLRDDAGAWRAAGYPIAEPLVVAHEALSAPSGRKMLHDYAPTRIVIDEAHRFAAPESARWRRLREYVESRPDTRVVVMSGSLTWRSLRQCRHLLLASLRANCPLPIDEELEYWASALDSDTEPTADDVGVVWPLVPWVGESRLPAPPGLRGIELHRHAARAAWGIRLASCPGVVTTDYVAAPVALGIEVLAPRPPASIATSLHRLATTWELPDGTQITEASVYARARLTLACGFFLRWRPETVAPAYVEAARELARTVRALVEYDGGRWQTPGAVSEAWREGAWLPARVRAAFEAFADAETAWPSPESEAVWLEGGLDYAVRSVTDVANEHAGAGPAPSAPVVVWVQSPELGTALARALCVPYHGAGSAPPAGGLAIASSRVHGTGWNGAPRAGYRAALVMEPPANGAAWEQLLARLHRSDAREDVTYRVHASEGATTALENALADARYSAATGGPQRLLLADWRGLRPCRVPAAARAPR